MPYVTYSATDALRQICSRRWCRGSWDINNTTIDIDTHVAYEKYQEIGKFGKAMEVAKLGEMDNSGMMQTLQ